MVALARVASAVRAVVNLRADAAAIGALRVGVRCAVDSTFVVVAMSPPSPDAWFAKKLQSVAVSEPPA